MAAERLMSDHADREKKLTLLKSGEYVLWQTQLHGEQAKLKVKLLDDYDLIFSNLSTHNQPDHVTQDTVIEMKRKYLTDLHFVDIPGLEKKAPIITMSSEWLLPKRLDNTPRIERPPGTHMLSVAEFVCSRKTYERVFEQTIYDMREDYYSICIGNNNPYKLLLERARIRAKCVMLFIGLLGLTSWFGLVDKFLGIFKAGK